MTAITLPGAGIVAGYVEGESGWGAAMNRNLRVLDALLNITAIDKDLAAPPSATPGAVYIVAGSATGAWEDQSGKLAVWCEGDDLVDAEWLFVTPKESWRAWVEDENVFYQYVSGAWVIDNTSSVSPEQYDQLIGDGSAANFFISHNLGTRNVHVTVYRNASPWDSIIVDVSRPNENMVEISGFAIAPSVDEYVVLVSK